MAVESARSGDRQAFESLVELRLNETFRTALAILGSEADARDATQEAFLKAWRELDRLREPDRFDAWFGRILVNTCRSTLRQRRRRQVRELQVEDSAADSWHSPARPLDDRLGELDALERAFDRLSIGERTVLTLHYLHHRSVDDMATTLGVPQGTVKSRLHAARRAFARALEVTGR